MQHREPIFNVPSVVLGLLGVFIAVHVGRQILPIEDNTWLLLAMAFIPARYAGMAPNLPGGEFASVTSVVTHMFVHADVVHLAINSAWLLAFGSVLSARMGAARFLSFALFGGMAGALLFCLMHPGLVAPVIGASGAIAAMMGGVLRFLFVAIDRKQGYLLRAAPNDIPRMSLSTALTDRRILSAAAIFVGINVLAIYGFGSMGSAGAIAWEAHLGGFFFGLLAFALFDTAAQNTSPSSTKVE